MCYKSWVRSLFLVTRLAFLVIAFSEDMQYKALEPSLNRQTWISETRSIRSFTSGNHRMSRDRHAVHGVTDILCLSRDRKNMIPGDRQYTTVYRTDRKTNTIRKQELNQTAYRQAGSLETGTPCCLETGTPRQSRDRQTMLSEDRHSATV